MKEFKILQKLYNQGPEELGAFISCGDSINNENSINLNKLEGKGLIEKRIYGIWPSGGNKYKVHLKDDGRLAVENGIENYIKRKIKPTELNKWYRNPGWIIAINSNYIYDI